MKQYVSYRKLSPQFLDQPITSRLMIWSNPTLVVKKSSLVEK